jgi:hypothetical protein
MVNLDQSAEDLLANARWEHVRLLAVQVRTEVNDALKHL